MNEIFLKFINMSLTAGWLVLAAVVLRVLFKKAPKWISCLLWGVVAIRLVLPFSFESIFSLIPSKEPLPETVISENFSTFNIDTGIRPIDTPVNNYLNNHY